MDVQLKKGLLDVCVLSVISKEESYGYKIIKDVSSCMVISESTLYPILKRLEIGDFLTVYSVEYNGRLRKYYKITEKGIKRIDEFLNERETILKIYNFIKGGRYYE